MDAHSCICLGLCLPVHLSAMCYLEMQQWLLERERERGWKDDKELTFFHLCCLGGRWLEGISWAQHRCKENGRFFLPSISSFLQLSIFCIQSIVLNGSYREM